MTSLDFDAPRLEAALRAVLELHQPHEVNGPGNVLCSSCNKSWGGGEPYPCPTVRAIESALSEGEGES